MPSPQKIQEWLSDKSIKVVEWNRPKYSWRLQLHSTSERRSVSLSSPPGLRKVQKRCTMLWKQSLNREFASVVPSKGFREGLGGRGEVSPAGLWEPLPAR